MSHFPVPLRAWMLTALLVPTYAMSVPAGTLFKRDDTCGAADLFRCPFSTLPSNFCCAAGESCTALAGSTTMLCCPKGAACLSIKPITCDLSMQDASAYPNAPIKTTILNGQLPKCGSACCPFGYSCNGQTGLCDRDSDQSKAPASKSDSPTSSSAQKTATGTPSLTLSPAPKPTGTDTRDSASNSGTAAPVTDTNGGNTIDSDAKPATNNTPAIIGGAVGGVAFLALIGVLVFFLLRRRKAAASVRDSTSSFGDMGKKQISNPIPIPGQDNYWRSDFQVPAAAGGGGSEYSPSMSQHSTARDSVNLNNEPASPRSFTGGSAITGRSVRKSSFGLPTSPSQYKGSPRSHHPSAEIPPISRKVSEANVNSLRASSYYGDEGQSYREPSTLTLNIGMDLGDTQSAHMPPMPPIPDSPPRIRVNRPESEMTTWEGMMKRGGGRDTMPSPWKK